MSFWAFFWLSVKINLLVNAVLWLVSLVRRNVTVIDPFWGLGFAIMVSGLWLAAPPTSSRGALVAWMAWIWGLRCAPVVGLLDRRRGNAVGVLDGGQPRADDLPNSCASRA